MSNCLKYEELISAMLDGEITSAEEKELTEHIAHCASCRKMYETYKEVFSSFDDVMQEPPAELKENVMSAIKTSHTVFTPVVVKKTASEKQKAKRVWVKYAAAAACLVIIVSAVPSLFSGSKSAAPESAGKTDGAYDMVTDAPADMPADKPTADAPADESAPELPEPPSNGETPDMPAEETEGDFIIDPSSPADDIIRDEPTDEPTTEAANMCLIYINGTLPDILANEAVIENGDGTSSIYIAPDTAMALINSGYDIKYTISSDFPIDQHIVIYKS